MIHRHLTQPLQLFTASLLMIGLFACSQQPDASAPQQSPVAEASPAPTPTETSNGRDLTPLFSHIWRVSDDGSQPQSSSIYVFLPNDTVLETSCTETYRVAAWTVDKAAPDVLKVMENGELAFTAKIIELTNATLQLQENLVKSNEVKDVKLEAIEQEFVCPDLPR